MLSLKHHRSHVVDSDDVAFRWLNEHTFGDILEHGAPVYNHKEEHMGLSFLHPGKYHLDILDIKEVEEDPGYQELKKLMKDRIRLIPPKGKGYYVTIEILPSEHYVQDPNITPENSGCLFLKILSASYESAAETTS